MGAGVKSVVISGASSGIGRACALALARQRLRVFVGVRNAAAAESLRAAGRGAIEPIELDVTVPSG